MRLAEIETLIRDAETHGVASLDFAQGTATLRLTLANAANAASLAASTPAPRRVELKAPAAGVFRSAHPSTDRRHIEPGALVARGEIVAFLEVGPCLRPVVSPVAGVLGEMLVEDGMLVGYGTALFALR